MKINTKLLIVSEIYVNCVNPQRLSIWRRRKQYRIMVHKCHTFLCTFTEKKLENLYKMEGKTKDTFMSIYSSWKSQKQKKFGQIEIYCLSPFILQKSCKIQDNLTTNKACVCILVFLISIQCLCIGRTIRSTRFLI